MATSSVNGKYVVIRRIDDSDADYQINIAEIEIFDNTKKIIYKKEDISVSSVYQNKKLGDGTSNHENKKLGDGTSNHENKRYKFGKEQLCDENTQTIETDNKKNPPKELFKFYASSNNNTNNNTKDKSKSSNFDDRKPTILITLPNSSNISSIKLYGRPLTPNRLLGVYVEIYNINKELIFSKKIINSDLNSSIATIYTEREIIQEYSTTDICINQKQCCYPLPPINYTTTLDNMNTNINSMLKTNIENINKKISNINQLIDTLNNVKQDFEKLNNAYIINSGAIDSLNQLIKDALGNSSIQQKTIEIRSNYQTQEIAGFTNYNSNSSSRDKKLEKFANFVQPNINFYENFTNWQNDWEKNLTNVKYNPISTNSASSKVDTIIPIIDQSDMIAKMEQSVSKLISNKIIKNGNRIMNQ